MIDGVDLEGREWQSFTDDYGAKRLVLTIAIKKSSTTFTEAQLKELKAILPGEFSKVYSQHGRVAELIIIPPELMANYIDPKTGEIDENKTIVLDLYNTTVKWDAKYSTHGLADIATPLSGVAKVAVGEISYNFDMTQDIKMLEMDHIVRTSLHELGHKGGLPHPWRKGTTSYHYPSDLEQLDKYKSMSDGLRQTILDNLMNSHENPIERLRSVIGTELTPGQMNLLDRTIKINHKRQEFIKNSELKKNQNNDTSSKD